MVAKIGLAYLEVFRKGNPVAGRNILQNIPAGTAPNGFVALARWDFAMLERDYPAAEKIASDLPAEDFRKNADTPKTFYQGVTALARGGIHSAHRYFAAAKPSLEGWYATNPTKQSATLNLDYSTPTCRGRKMPSGKLVEQLNSNRKVRTHFTARFTRLISPLCMHLWVSHDQAITLIERLLTTSGAVSWPDDPASMTVADLRLRWEWDALRSNPRFQKILAGLEPPTILPVKGR